MWVSHLTRHQGYHAHAFPLHDIFGLCFAPIWGIPQIPGSTITFSSETCHLRVSPHLDHPTQSVISGLVFLSLNRSSHSQWSLAHRQVPKVMGHGFNTFGLPGDPSPPSRFVKMFFERQIALTNSPPKKKVEDGREPWKVVSYPIVGTPQKDAEMWETWKYVYIYILSDLVYMMKYHLYNYNCLETRFYYLFGDGYNGW